MKNLFASPQSFSAQSGVSPVKRTELPLMIKILQKIFKVGSVIAPKLSAKLAYNIWIKAPRFKTPASEIKASENALLKYYQIGPHNIATYHWGTEGPKVLLMHGWSGRGTQLGQIAVELMNQGFQVISFDAPAHGKSSGSITNLYEFADCIRGLNNQLGPFDAAISHSLGGLCLALAQKRGLELNCVVNISPPSTSMGLVHKFSEALAIPQNVEKQLIIDMEKKFGTHVWQDTSMLENVKELQTPALVIHDQHDNDIPWSEGEAVANAWPDAKLKSTSSLGHRRILRDKETIEAVVKFIQQY